MTAHVGDFGLARFKVDSTASSLGDSNSSSYFDARNLLLQLQLRGPLDMLLQCARRRQVSTASDVYSFGVILLEIFIQRRPTDDMFEDGLTIAKFTEINFPDKVLQIVGPQLLQELDPRQETPMAVKEKGVRCLIYVLNIGLCCTKTSPSERTSMQEVAAKLHGIRDAYLRGNGRIISYRKTVTARHGLSMMQICKMLCYVYILRFACPLFILFELA